MTVFVTGGAGFIGSALARDLINQGKEDVVIIDKLTYAGSLESLKPVSNSPRYHFSQTDICDREGIGSLFAKYKPRAVYHLAGRRLSVLARAGQGGEGRVPLPACLDRRGLWRARGGGAVLRNQPL